MAPTRARKAVVTALVTVALLLTGCFPTDGANAKSASDAANAAVNESDVNSTVTVTKVIDGDTIVVAEGSRTHTVRLLNVDAPETKHPDWGVQCMGPEASDFLTQLLPAGTPVRPTRIQRQALLQAWRQGLVHLLIT